VAIAGSRKASCRPSPAMRDAAFGCAAKNGQLAVAEPLEGMRVSGDTFAWYVKR
jgi:hypothetical protein